MPAKRKAGEAGLTPTKRERRAQAMRERRANDLVVMGESDFDAFVSKIAPKNNGGKPAAWFKATQPISDCVDEILKLADSLKIGDIMEALDEEGPMRWVHGQPESPSVAVWIPPEKVDNAARLENDVGNLGRLLQRLFEELPAFAVCSCAPCLLIYPTQAELNSMKNFLVQWGDGAWVPVRVGRFRSQVWHMDAAVGQKGSSNFLWASKNSPWTDVSNFSVPKTIKMLIDTAKTKEPINSQAKAFKRKLRDHTVTPPGSFKNAQGGACGITWDGQTFHRGVGYRSRRSAVFCAGHSYHSVHGSDCKKQYYGGKKRQELVVTVEMALNAIEKHSKQSNYAAKTERLNLLNKLGLYFFFFFFCASICGRRYAGVDMRVQGVDMRVQDRWHPQ